jgi:hypothetical protein
VLLGSPYEENGGPFGVAQESEPEEQARMRFPRTDRDVLVLDRPGPKALLVHEVAQAEGHEALLTAANSDESDGSSLSIEEGFEAELEVRVIPARNVLGDDRKLAGIGAKVLSQEYPERRFLLRLGLERDAKELAEQLAELVEPLVHDGRNYR